MKHRLERVREVIKRELSELIVRELTFPSALVTVQDVDVTPDLKHSNVYISALGSEADRDAAFKKLQENRAMLQQAMSKRVVLKYTPQIHFRLDTSIERGSRIIEILQKIEIPEGDEEPAELETEPEHATDHEPETHPESE